MLANFYKIYTLTATKSLFEFTMVAKILDGKSVAKTRLDHLQSVINQHIQQRLQPPCLAVVLVGNDPASEIYVKRKRQACKKVGIKTEDYTLASSTTQNELLALIDRLNQSPQVHGILVQLPLPAHIDTGIIIEAIVPEKDVDGFHPYNLGRLAQQRPTLRPCTPYGVMQLLAHYQLEIAGKHAVIVGASNIVGRPMALELLMAGCTVTICHRQTQNLPQHIQQADILVSAMGNPAIIQSDWIKPDSIVIDVGITRQADGSLSGDIDFNSATARAGWITPVPGGVGPMTVAMLLENTWQAAIK
jgi:methylenetetrahydrofolate dehydrogenase (NADP+)/methenyltetrahydrofolate cyclohydrolase